VSPQRIQQSRVKGWRKPEGAVSVARPGRWGNPFAAKITRGEAGQATMTRQLLVDDYRAWLLTPVTKWPDRPAFAGGDTGRTHLLGVPFEGRPTVEAIREHLAGRDLMCWCPTSQPCHGDVLLRAANTTDPITPEDSR